MAPWTGRCCGSWTTPLTEPKMDARAAEDSKIEMADNTAKVLKIKRFTGLLLARGQGRHLPRSGQRAHANDSWFLGICRSKGYELERGGRAASGVLVNRLGHELEMVGQPGEAGIRNLRR